IALVVEKGSEGSGQDPALHLSRQRNNLSFGFGNVIRSSIHSDHGAKLPIPADHIIHHQAGGREKVFALQPFLLTPANPATTTQQQQERINAGPEVSTFPDAGPEVSTFPDVGLEVAVRRS
ncbi:hypothetical protein THAOC_10300, partial [Thalassiosira oceanica]